MKLNTTKVLLSALAALLFASSANAQQPGTNIALGRSVTYNAAPNYYAATMDRTATGQLTDGKYVSRLSADGIDHQSFWTQNGTVGWQYVNPVFITVDLGSAQSISGVSFSTAGGRAGVSWPIFIYVATSDDNKTWHGAGNLVEISRKNGAPPAEGYGTFHYVTHDLKTHGRYVNFAIANAPYIFTDEVEVYAGEKQWMNEPLTGETFSSLDGIKTLALESVSVMGARRRMAKDAAAVRAAVEEHLSAGLKSTFLAQLAQQEKTIDDFSKLPNDFKTILPLSETDRNIFAVYGQLLAAQGLKPLTVWKQHRYAWLPLLAKPVTDEKPQLHFSMLKNQFRSDALFLTNASASPQTVNLKLANAPQNAQPDWLKVDSVAWTDTYQADAVADALIPVDATNGVYSITVPAGMTRKVWFTVDSSKVPAGVTKSTFQVTSNDLNMQVPVDFDISSIAMKKPRISLGMWDYTNGNGMYGITPQNRKAAIALMRSHYVDSPWASGAALPMPGAAAFDAHNNLIGKLNFTNLDQWIARWPGAKHYFVFPNVGSSFAGTEMNTPAFAARVGSWAKALSAHMKELGLQPQQLGILLVDEPRKDAQDAIIAAWAKAINATAPQLTLFEDPVWARPDQTKIQDAITEIDILSPQLPIYYKAGKPVKDYYANLREQGKELWFYSCTGPIRTYDPQTYFRYQAWHTFALGGKGQGFWSFADTGNTASSFNEYAAGGVNFAPAFLDQTSAYDSVHWDAVREGMEDYEELAMLQDAINASKNETLKMQAQQVLNDAVQTIVGTWKDESDLYSWSAQKYDPPLGDAQLAKVRAMLEKLER